jgi:hypothetical protein
MSMRICLLSCNFVLLPFVTFSVFCISIVKLMFSGLVSMVW